MKNDDIIHPHSSIIKAHQGSKITFTLHGQHLTLAHCTSHHKGYMSGLLPCGNQIYLKFSTKCNTNQMEIISSWDAAGEEK